LGPFGRPGMRFGAFCVSRETIWGLLDVPGRPCNLQLRPPRNLFYLQVASCKLQVASCKLQVASCKLQVASCKLQVASCRFAARKGSPRWRSLSRPWRSFPKPWKSFRGALVGGQSRGPGGRPGEPSLEVALETLEAALEALEVVPEALEVIQGSPRWRSLSRPWRPSRGGPPRRDGDEKARRQSRWERSGGNATCNLQLRPRKTFLVASCKLHGGLVQLATCN
jgi:hypothetical protein